MSRTDHPGLFKKGEGGRPPGATNKLTRTVRETVLEVFNEIQDDPKVKLLAFAKKYPRDFYAIAAKLIPIELQASIDININWIETKTYDPIPEADNSVRLS